LNRCGKANGVVCSHEIVIDGARAANDLTIPVLTQSGRPIERAVAADRNECINVVFSKDVCGGSLPLFGPKLFAATAAEMGSTVSCPGGDAIRGKVASAIGIHKELFVDHSVVATHDSYDFVTLSCCGSYDGPDASIHPRRITATAKYSNFHFFVHIMRIGLFLS
jgi:hypothetical protein